jgi:hypothetical protein
MNDRELLFANPRALPPNKKTLGRQFHGNNDVKADKFVSLICVFQGGARRQLVACARRRSQQIVCASSAASCRFTVCLPRIARIVTVCLAVLSEAARD